MLFDEITASSLVKIDLDGRKVDGSPYDVNPAGFTIHSAIHAAREDAQCVLHIHSLNGVTVSAKDLASMRGSFAALRRLRMTAGMKARACHAAWTRISEELCWTFTTRTRSMA